MNHFNKYFRLKIVFTRNQDKNLHQHCICALQTIKKTSYNTTRFKVKYTDLINETFKTTINIIKDNDLIKIHHLNLDETKIKVKTSLNKLTNEDQIKIIETKSRKSIELGQQENEE